MKRFAMVRVFSVDGLLAYSEINKAAFRFRTNCDGDAILCTIALPLSIGGGLHSMVLRGEPYKWNGDLESPTITPFKYIGEQRKISINNGVLTVLPLDAHFVVKPEDQLEVERQHYIATHRGVPPYDHARFGETALLIDADIYAKLANHKF